MALSWRVHFYINIIHAFRGGRLGRRQNSILRGASKDVPLPVCMCMGGASIGLNSPRSGAGSTFPEKPDTGSKNQDSCPVFPDSPLSSRIPADWFRLTLPGFPGRGAARQAGSGRSDRWPTFAG